MVDSVKKNKYLLYGLFPLGLVIFLLITFPSVTCNIWDLTDENNFDIFNSKPFHKTSKEILFVIGVLYSVLLFFSWIFKSQKKIFSKQDFLRSFIIFNFSLALVIWWYSYDLAGDMCYVLLFISIFYGICNNKIYRPNSAMVFLFIYALLQLVGVLWNNETYNSNHNWVLKDQSLLLLLSVSSCFFQPTQKNVSVFISIVFKFCLLLLILHLSSYFLVMSYLDKNILSCFIFDKSYMSPLSYHEVFQFSIYKHPSFICWLLLIVGGISYFTVKRIEIKFVSRLEVIIYFLLLFFFVFIVQSRVAQLGYFIVIGSIAFFEFIERFSKKSIIIITILGMFFMALGVFMINKYTSFFEDPTRLKVYQKSFEYFFKKPLFGSGTLIELKILKEVNLTHPSFHHLHNDFIMSIVRHGVLGITLLLSWIVLLFINSINSKNTRLIFFLIPTVLIMITDSALFYKRILTVTVTFLFMLSSSSHRKFFKIW